MTTGVTVKPFITNSVQTDYDVTSNFVITSVLAVSTNAMLKPQKKKQWQRRVHSFVVTGKYD